MSHLTDQINQLEADLTRVATAEAIATLDEPSARFVAERVLSGTPVPQNEATRKALASALDQLS